MSQFLEVADLGERLGDVVGRARRLKADPTHLAGHLTDRRIGLYFELPSLRTRVSSEVAVYQLGGQPVVLTGEGVGIDEREPARDVARVLSRMLDALALRVRDHRSLERLAAHADIPVINLLSDREHPCQALADLAAITDHKPVESSTVAYLGDPNNVARSLAAGVVALGGTMRVGTPESLAPDPASFAAGTEFFTDPDDAVDGADVVYTDVWTSMGRERDRDDQLRALRGWGVDIARFGRAADDAVFLHCLPAHRGEEVATEVIEHPRSRVFDQAEYRLHSFAALLCELV